MRTPLASLIALAAACGPSSKPAVVEKPRAVTPPPTDVVDDSIAEPEVPEDPEAARQRRVSEALVRVPDLIGALEKLRGLAFKAEVPSEYQDTDSFRTFVAAEVALELGAEKGAVMTTAMHHIGLLAEPVDLPKTFEDAMVSQAAAYYDPKQKKFFVVMVPKEDSELDTIAVHELTHALQDQHFDLQAYMTTTPPLEDDAAWARKFVVEGEATLTMFVYAGEQMAGASLGGKSILSPEYLPLLKPGFQQAAAMTLDDFKGATKAQAEGATGVDEDIQKSLDAMDTIPPLVLVPMMDSYMKGCLAVLTAYEAGGWAEVSNLYTNPPSTTEQVLHPDTKLYPTRDEPHAITLPTLKGYTDVYGNTIGELEWRVYFMLWNKAAGDAAAAGWDGDRWRVVKDRKGNLVGLVVSAWDSAAEAKEFAAAYEASIKARFPDGEREVWIKVKGENVFIVDGGTDAKLIDKLVKGTKIKG